jgi:hypothetical protein
MHVRLRDHRVDERQVVHARADVRHQFAHPLAALAARLPVPGRFQHRAGIALEQFDFTARIKLLSVPRDELRLVIKRVALARCAGHEELHDAFRLGTMM